MAFGCCSTVPEDAAVNLVSRGRSVCRVSCSLCDTEPDKSGYYELAYAWFLTVSSLTVLSLTWASRCEIDRLLGESFTKRVVFMYNAASLETFPF